MRAAVVPVLVLVLAACSGSGDDDVPITLAADAGPDVYAVVGVPVLLDGSGSTGAMVYEWSSGDGQFLGGAQPSFAYAAPGRYQAVLTVVGPDGARHSDAAVVSVTHPLTWEPSHTSTIVAVPGTPRFAAVSTDSDELVIVDPELGVLGRTQICDSPRSVTRWRQGFLVACDGSDLVVALKDGDTMPIPVALPRGSRPIGVVATGEGIDLQVFVALSGTGELAVLWQGPPGFDLRVNRVMPAIPDARGIALWPDGRIAVSRWRSPDDGGEIALIEPAVPGAEPEIIRLAVDPQAGSDTEIGGVPSYLGQILVSPTGREAAVPSLQANILEGTFRSQRPLTFETTVRGVVSWLAIDGPDVVEDFDRRKQFDDRGRAGGGVLSSRGDYLFVTMPGNRTIERIDVLGGDNQSGTLLDVGLDVDGVALSSDDRILAALAPLSREIVFYDVSSFATLPQPLARLPLVDAEPLPPDVLRGKQLFHDAADERLSKDGYIACAHCHLDGLSDNRTWDFTDRGEGLRNTHALGGHAQQGLLHWSANFDEVQDFEHDLRGPFRGRGLMTDDVFHTGTRDTTLGDAKAGLSGDLDALAAYVASLREIRSPFRNPDGSLPAAAVRGQALFATLGCAGCHSGAQFTDSGFVSPGEPRLHDVGTLGPGSGQRLGAPLTGLDTPTLHGLWHAAPYLHDGSAATLDDVLSRHAPPLTTAERADLIAFLLALEG